MTSSVYRFGEYCLDPTARELWRGDEPHPLPRLIFDSLVFLVENRDRAVSRDELIAAAWGRSHVEDIQVTQLIMRLRRALGDDSHAPRYVGTVPGFGYRWVADTAVSDHADEIGVPPPDDSAPADGKRDLGRRYRLAAGVVVLAGLSLTLILIRFGERSMDEAVPLVREPGEAVAVLPLEVRESDHEADWVRLGVMDLITGRLRDAGLPTSPSDSVIAALYAAGELHDGERDAELRRTLGAGVLVRGVADWTTAGWTIELVAHTNTGERRRVHAGPADIIPAGGEAAELLLAALGHASSPPPAEGDNTLSELLQRARAAALAMEIDTARELLVQAPEPIRNHPRLLNVLAGLEFRAGRREQAQEMLTELLAAEEVQRDPQLYASALTMAGIVALNRQDDLAAGAAYFDTAVSVLEDDLWLPELGRALAMRGGARAGLDDFEQAVRDLGRARALFEIGGDRAGVALIHNYFGNLELRRGRPGDALAHFEASMDISQAFGNVDGVRANLFALLAGRQQLLRWSDALETGDRMWSLRERISNPASRYLLEMAYADLLVSTGRLARAEEILATWQGRDSELPAYALREGGNVRAKLAWYGGRYAEAVAAAARALDPWPAHSSPITHTRPPVGLALLWQRAAIVAGNPEPVADHLPESDRLAEQPAYLIARGEWAAFEGDHEAAEHWFEMAVARAEQLAVPAELVRTASAYAHWLLEHRRVAEALALAGRVADWAETDYDAALLQVAVYRAGGRREAWEVAVQYARRLAGERTIPPDLLQPLP